MAFYFKNTKEDIIMTKKDQELRDHCHLTGKYRGPAHNTCNINVTQKQSKFIKFISHNFSNFDSHMFFRRLVDMKNDTVKFDKIPETNKEFISVT